MVHVAIGGIGALVLTHPSKVARSLIDATALYKLLKVFMCMAIVPCCIQPMRLALNHTFKMDSSSLLNMKSYNFWKHE